MSTQPERLDEGTMIIVFKVYLQRLAQRERGRPASQRKSVPSLDEIAKAVGIHPVTLSNIVNNNIRQLNLETGGKIITYMRQRGFETSVSDIVEYLAPTEGEKSQQQKAITDHDHDHLENK